MEEFLGIIIVMISKYIVTSIKFDQGTSDNIILTTQRKNSQAFYNIMDYIDRSNTQVGKNSKIRSVKAELGIEFVGLPTRKGEEYIPCIMANWQLKRATQSL